MDDRTRERIMAIAREAIAAVDPATAIRRHVKLEKGCLIAGPSAYRLDRFERVFIVGAGKASARMACVLEELLKGRVEAGVVVVKDGHAEQTRIVEVVEAGHPQPDDRGAQGARKVLEIVSRAGPRDLVVAAMSGGGSALLPAFPKGIELAPMRELTGLLLRSGATINEMNAVRKHLSLIQGGRLAAACNGAAILSLLVSDVVGSPLDVIASGPTCPDTTSYSDALDVLAKYGLMNSAPAAAIDHLRRGAAGELPETPKPGDPIFERVQNLIVADNDLAAEAAVEAATRAGFNAQLVSTRIEGEAREVAKVLAGIAWDMAVRRRPLPPPACLVFGGETTVGVKGPGRGGRNQEMALAAALALQGVPDLAVLCLGTDGTDGPTDAAGGLIDGGTVERGRRLGMDARKHLADNDSYPFLASTGDLVVTGPTRTNVNDLIILFALEGLP